MMTTIADVEDGLLMLTPPSGPGHEGTQLTIEVICGFEKFNTRPYHCYETWCKGFRLTDPRLKWPIEREHLSDLLEAWGKALSDV